MTIYFTSDTHLGHTNIIRYCDRPFQYAKEMDDEIISQVERTIRRNDTLVHLGDISMNPAFTLRYLDAVKGKIIFCFGNHDKKKHKKIITSHKSVIYYGHILDLKGLSKRIICCHYAPTLEEYVQQVKEVKLKDYDGALHAYGHSHCSLPPVGKSLDVGVDSAYRLLGEFRPFSYEELIRFADTEEGQKRQEEIVANYLKERGERDNSNGKGTETLQSRQDKNSEK